MLLLRAIWKALAVVLAAVAAAGPRRRERIVAAGEPARRAELAVIALLVGVACFAVMFIVIYAADWKHQTQLLGLAIEEEYPDVGDRDEEEKLIQVVEESGSRMTRKRFLKGAAGAAGAALGAALVVPAVSLGPALDTESLYYSPWYRGRRLVDENGRPYRADDISTTTFYTAYPENVDHEVLAAPIVVVRIKPDRIDLPASRADWAPEGILAYSKICTHAGCAISEYRKPLFPPTSPEPAFVCPCHYSTFDPATGGSVIYGPAGRNLPQLPLMIDHAGELRAAGDFNDPVGPSFWGVRSGGPT